METLIITEQKKSLITDIILVVIFGLIPLSFLLHWLLQADDGWGFIVFLMVMVLIFPLVVLAGYIWDVKKKIILFQEGITLCYGRSIVQILHGEDTFRLSPDLEIPWRTISGFAIDATEHRESTEGGGYSTFLRYGLMIKIRTDDQKIFSFESYSHNYFMFSLARFEAYPNIILKTCEDFQHLLLSGKVASD